MHDAAAGHDTLVAITVAVLAGGAILFPALAFLFRLAVTGGFAATEDETREVAASRRPHLAPRLLVRSAAACLIAGFGLLNVADAAWAHAVGLVCLFTFVVLGFYAIAIPQPDESR